MDKVKFSVVFNRKKQLNAHGKALVQIECYLNGKRKYFSTGIYIKPTEWNEKTRSIKNNAPNYIGLNKQIKDKITAFESYELQKINAGKPFALDMLQEVERPQIKSFYEFMRLEIDTNPRTTKGTKADQRQTLNLLQRYRKELIYDEITFEFLHDFEKWIRTQTFSNGKKYSQNSIFKHFKNLRTFVNLAINKEHIPLEKYPFRKFKVQQENKERTYLTPNEIDLFTAVEVKDKAQEVAKDLYLFAVYTGLRYSDIINLQTSEIVKEKGVIWIVKRTQKTNEPIKIPLSELFNGKAFEIVKKYRKLGNLCVFPKVSNGELNAQIKTLCEVAGIQKNITFHTARHTNATFLLSKGMSIFAVQKMLGHRKISTTQIYTHLIEETLLNELKAINF